MRAGKMVEEKGDEKEEGGIEVGREGGWDRGGLPRPPSRNSRGVVRFALGGKGIGAGSPAPPTPFASPPRRAWGLRPAPGPPSASKAGRPQGRTCALMCAHVGYVGGSDHGGPYQVGRLQISLRST